MNRNSLEDEKTHPDRRRVVDRDVPCGECTAVSFDGLEARIEARGTTSQTSDAWVSESGLCGSVVLRHECWKMGFMIA